MHSGLSDVCALLLEILSDVTEGAFDSKRRHRAAVIHCPLGETSQSVSKEQKAHEQQFTGSNERKAQGERAQQFLPKCVRRVVHTAPNGSRGPPQMTLAGARGER